MDIEIQPGNFKIIAFPPLHVLANLLGVPAALLE